MITVIIAFAAYANAQNVAMNTNGAVADASAMLDVASTSKGFLPPRMTTIQRTGIPSPANGLLVFDIDTKTYWYYSDGWKEAANSGGGSFNLPYSGSYSDPYKVFSIANTGSTNGSSAIYGKSGTNFSGWLIDYTAGIWGDNTNSNGYGVLGTSNSGIGIFGSSSQDHGVYGRTSTMAGYAGVYGTSSNSNGIGVKGEVNNGGYAIYGVNNGGQGSAGYFHINNTVNDDDAVQALTVGTRRALIARINNSNSTAEAFHTSTNGKGRALYAGATNALNTDDVVFVNNAGLGSGIHVYSSQANAFNWLIYGVNNGLGGGLNLNINNANATAHGIQVVNDGSGSGIFARSVKGNAGFFWNENVSNTSSVIRSINNGSSLAGEFSISNETSFSSVLMATTNGTGPGIVINNTNANAVSSLATFKKNGASKARIDGTGKGFFNGGTQNSGADIAEAFDVNGNRYEYEAGDVLVISIDKDRTVEKSNGAYSTLVAGVYATKPGVLLTEEEIETDISDKVPMGVVGVIPTKVCVEGGEIKRGDLLVTSSVTGVAMKADINKVKPGQVIGKALENFTSKSVDKIRVLVNVR